MHSGAGSNHADQQIRSSRGADPTLRLWLCCLPVQMWTLPCVGDSSGSGQARQRLLPEFCALSPQYSTCTFGASKVSDYCLQSTEQLQNMSADASLLFFFKSGFQSWLMFAQKYVIADFLLLAPSRASCQACVLLLLSPGLGQTQGVPSKSQGHSPLSARQPVCLAAATKGKDTHSLHVADSICFPPPLDKQIVTGLFMRNPHLPFP